MENAVNDLRELKVNRWSQKANNREEGTIVMQGQVVSK
jgi:hypothetical protein